MSRRTGSTDLPLHGGRVPRWLAQRMERLGRVIVEAIAHHYGRDEVLERLSDPFWFQSFGAVMGMDWHSSGITTSVLGALKRGLQPVENELGIHVCGGRGRHSRQTPAELLRVGDHTGLDGDALARTSRLVAKVDSAAVQDGFALYLHGFVVSDGGKWTVVQQGMAPAGRTARRYHWSSDGLTDYLVAPHRAIEGEPGNPFINLTDRRAGASREAQLELVANGPAAVVETLKRAVSRAPVPPHLDLPAHHDVRASDVFLRRLHATLAAAADRGPTDFADLLLMPGVGARTVESLAAVAEVVHGAPARFEDPARFSLALGGKDGHPFPVPLKVYDETIQVLRRAVDQARLGNDDRLSAIERLDRQARLLEGVAEGPGLETLLAMERQRAAAWGGRTVFDAKRRDERRSAGQQTSRGKGQLSLF